jgi:hypothetical protein
MAEPKTRPTSTSVMDFLRGLPDDARRADCRKLLAIMRQATGAKPRMWGPSMVGFGSYHYKYASGREGDWFLVGFSPRKRDLTVYIMPGFERYATLLGKLGKHKTGRSCLYLKRLADVDIGVLEQLISDSVAHMKQKYGA